MHRCIRKYRCDLFQCGEPGRFLIESIQNLRLRMTTCISFFGRKKRTRATERANVFFKSSISNEKNIQHSWIRPFNRLDGWIISLVRTNDFDRLPYQKRKLKLAAKNWTK